jgi:hypothetical protein
MVLVPYPAEVLPLFGLYLLGLVAFSYAIAADARARGVRFASILGAVGAVFGLIGIAYYLVRERFGSRAYRASKWERAAWTYFGAMTVAMLLGTVLSPPDPLTQARQFPMFLLVTLPLAYLVVFRNLWGRLRAEVR